MYEEKYRKKVHSLILIIVATVMAIVVGTVYFTPKSVKADTNVAITDINYFDDTITLQVNDKDNKVYFSDSYKKSWKEVPGRISGSNTVKMDISWISPSTDYVLTFKGDYSTSVVGVTIPKQVTDFKATYNKSKGTVSFGNTHNRTIQWRKKGSSTWNTVYIGTISTELNYLCNEGATIYFRLQPENGSSRTNTGCRASREVSLTIPAKSDAPKVKINGSSFSISVTKDEAYRIVNSDLTTTAWTNITRTQNMPLSKLAAASMYSNAQAKQSEVTLQFRTNSSSTRQVSKIATVTVPVQEGPPSMDTYGISLSYTSSSTVSILVKAASTTVPFEYTIVKKNEDLDYMSADWNAITSNEAVSINDDAAPQGSHIYIRKKSVEKTDDTDFALASVEVDLTGTNGVAYPEEPSASTLTTLIANAGYCKETDSTSYLSFTLYSPVETTVASISFLDSYGVNQGDATLKSTVAKNKKSTGINNAYIITTKITSTSKIDAVTEKLLYAKITLANSDVIKSTDTAGIRLFLYPYTTVHNPAAEEKDQYSDYSKYSANFSRIYESTASDDDKYFKFKLDLGTAYVPSPVTAASYTDTAVGIGTLKYQGYTLTAGTDYTTSYGSYVNDDDKTITTLTVTINVANFEKASSINITGSAQPLLITLNNGETLNGDINITLVDTATLSKKFSSSFIEGGLKETKITSTTTSGGTTSTTDERIDYTLTLTLFDPNYDVSVTDVTWGGTSVLGSTTISNGTATVNLSNAKLNKLTVDTSTTNNLVITFSNGYSITSGAALTILNSGR